MCSDAGAVRRNWFHGLDGVEMKNFRKNDLLFRSGGATVSATGLKNHVQSGRCLRHGGNLRTIKNAAALLADLRELCRETGMGATLDVFLTPSQVRLFCTGLKKPGKVVKILIQRRFESCRHFITTPARSCAGSKRGCDSPSFKRNPAAGNAFTTGANTRKAPRRTPSNPTPCGMPSKTRFSHSGCCTNERSAA